MLEVVMLRAFVFVLSLLIAVPLGAVCTAPPAFKPTKWCIPVPLGVQTRDGSGLSCSTTPDEASSGYCLYTGDCGFVVGSCVPTSTLTSTCSVTVNSVSVNIFRTLTATLTCPNAYFMANNECHSYNMAVEDQAAAARGEVITRDDHGNILSRVE